MSLVRQPRAGVGKSPRYWLLTEWFWLGLSGSERISEKLYAFCSSFLAGYSSPAIHEAVAMIARYLALVPRHRHDCLRGKLRACATTCFLSPDSRADDAGFVLALPFCLPFLFLNAWAVADAERPCGLDPSLARGALMEGPPAPIVSTSVSSPEGSHKKEPCKRSSNVKKAETARSRFSQCPTGLRRFERSRLFA